jgi:iron complex transport system substrate-binding protein
MAALALSVAGIELWRRLVGPRPAEAGARILSVSGYPRLLSDSSGARIIINAPPRRIVSQTLGTDEILLAICSPERIAGLSHYALDPRYSNVAEQARSISARPVRSAEDILSLNPDLIFVASYSRAEIVELLRSAGAPVFRFSDFSTVESIKANIRAVAYAVGEESRGQELIEWMEREIQFARARIVPGRSPRLISYDPWSGTAAGADTLFDDMVRLIGAINVVAEQGLRGFPKISDEQILKWQPDFIVIGAEAGEFDQARRQLLQKVAVASSRARIIAIEYRRLLAVSHYIVLGIRELAEGIYGEAR